MASLRSDNDGRSAQPGHVIDLATLAALLDHAHDAVIVRGFDGEILYWNKGAERTYGWSSAEATGRTSNALLKARLPKPLVVIEEALREFGEWEGRIVHERKDGDVVTVESRWALDAASGGAIFLEINRDITAKLKAQEAARAREHQLRFVTDSAPVLIAHCDKDSRFKFVNKPYAARFGLHPSELVGRTVSDVLGERAYDTIKPYIARALAGERVEVELEVPYEIIGRQFMRFAYEPELDDTGHVAGYVAAIINVSDRRAAEEALREADRRKDAFLATLAHELRNPLAAMRNAVHLMANADPDAARDRAAAILDRQLKQLVRLVDDLLDVSRITRGQLQLRISRVELSDIIGAAIESTALAGASLSHRFTVSLPEEPIHLDADAERLSQAFTNLFMNAAKYTPAGGRITVSAIASDDEVMLTVMDTGVGIPPDMLERVFDMFTQVEAARDQAHGGLGIGLTLVRVLVEMHGGTVTADSDGVNCGSTFTVRLPLTQPGARAQDERPATVPARSVVLKRVLIADDNLDAAESLQLWLERAGHEVHVAEDGPRALALAESVHPDVIVLDLGMPGMNGMDVARRIRETSWGQHAVLIALTGWGQEEDRRQSFEAGFDRHLTKPVPPDVVEHLIRDI